MIRASRTRAREARVRVPGHAGQCNGARQRPITVDLHIGRMCTSALRWREVQLVGLFKFGSLLFCSSMASHHPLDRAAPQRARRHLGRLADRQRPQHTRAKPSSLSIPSRVNNHHIHTALPSRTPGRHCLILNFQRSRHHTRCLGLMLLSGRRVAAFAVVHKHTSSTIYYYIL